MSNFCFRRLFGLLKNSQKPSFLPEIVKKWSFFQKCPYFLPLSLSSFTIEYQKEQRRMLFTIYSSPPAFQYCRLNFSDHRNFDKSRFFVGLSVFRKRHVSSVHPKSTHFLVAVFLPDVTIGTCWTVKKSRPVITKCHHSWIRMHYHKM